MKTDTQHTNRVQFDHFFLVFAEALRASEYPTPRWNTWVSYLAISPKGKLSIFFKNKARKLYNNPKNKLFTVNSSSLSLNLAGGVEASIVFSSTQSQSHLRRFHWMNASITSLLLLPRFRSNLAMSQVFLLLRITIKFVFLIHFIVHVF